MTWIVLLINNRIQVFKYFSSHLRALISLLLPGRKKLISLIKNEYSDYNPTNQHRSFKS